MSNLLSQKNKKNIREEYILRSITVFFSLLIVAVSIAIILLVPSFILSQVKVSEINQQIKLAKKIERLKKNIFLANILKSENEKIEALSSGNKVNFIGILKKIINDKPKNIKLEGFVCDKVRDEKTKNYKVRLILKGVASKRVDLVNFINRLKLEDELTTIISPVSNLVKDENLNFSISMVVLGKKI